MLCLLLSFSVLSIVMSLAAKQKICIIGGGIHGASLSYFLTHYYGDAAEVTLVERAPGASASYKAGGFLAREWGSGPTVALHTKGFDLIEQLSKDLDLKSYRKLDVIGIDGNRKGRNVASWLDRKASSSKMSGAAAQVTPNELTSKLLAAAEEKGATIIEAIATGPIFNEDQSRVQAIQLKDGSSIECDSVCLTSGIWTSVMAEDWFDVPIPAEGIKSTSIVYDNIPQIRDEPYAAFCDEQAEFNTHLELYPRPDGTLYICGVGGSGYVSGDSLRDGGEFYDPRAVKEDPKRVEAAAKSFASMTSLGDRPVSKSQACMRPCASDALPVMGRLPTTENAFVSSMHNCWGILWSAISGKSMAELIVTGESTDVDLRAFDAGRFMPRGAKRGRKMKDVNVGEQW